MNRPGQFIRILVIGLIMGAAEVVPGVSGGTIAFISGIYERLLNGIKQFTPSILFRLKDDGLATVWREVDASFLITLLVGMGISIILFASGVSYLLHHQPILIWSFFSGLVIASTVVVWKQIETATIDIGIATGIGLGFGIIITQLVPIELEPTPLMLFVGGSVAVCAWILPGLSGSFILLILGLYVYVIDFIKNFDFLNLAILGAGCALGLIVFAQLLSRMFTHHKDKTLAVLTGFMLGSLNKLWPWKTTTSYQIKADGSEVPLVQDAVWPHVYTSLTGQDADIMLAIVSAIFGAVLVLLLDRLAEPPPVASSR